MSHSAFTGISLIGYQGPRPLGLSCPQPWLLSHSGLTLSSVCFWTQGQTSVPWQALGPSLPSLPSHLFQNWQAKVVFTDPVLESHIAGSTACSNTYKLCNLDQGP